MSYLYKEYVDTDKPNSKIKITLTYNRDTYHWATSNRKEKGYQIVCTPVEVTNGDGYNIESFTAFQGFYDIIYPAERQSKKRLEHAISLIAENKERYLNHFRNQGIKV